VPKSAGNDGLKAELEKVQKQILEGYKQLVMDRCEFAEHRFDEITDHSRKDVANADAVAMALAEEKAKR
jgi:hypothetical protein